MKISESDEFKKDFKKLHKKYRSLAKDFAVLKQAILTEPLGDGTKHWNCLTRVESKDLSFLKVRMMCRSVRGASFRVVYMYDGDKLELLFIEIFFKGNKNVENQKRIEAIIKTLES